MKVKDTDLAYISAIFDLIGCIKIQTPKDGSLPYLFVWVTLTNFKIVEPFQKVGAVVSQRTDKKYRVQWWDYAAYNFLKLIWGSLKAKKEIAKVGIEFFEMKKENPMQDFDIPYKIRLKLLKQEE